MVPCRQYVDMHGRQFVRVFFSYQPLIDSSMPSIKSSNWRTRICVFRSRSDLSSVIKEQVRDSATSQRQEGKKRRRPLISKPCVHLRRKQNSRSSPERSDTSLRCQCRSGLVLIRVDHIVVGRVVQKDESESNRQSRKSWASPGQSWVRRPCEDEQPDRDEPAGQHHRV